MKTFKFKAVALAAMLGLSSVAVAQITASSTTSQMVAEFTSGMSAGTVVSNAAQMQGTANLSALVSALIAAGADASQVVSAAVVAGGNAQEIVNAAISAGADTQVVVAAAIGAGADPTSITQASASGGRGEAGERGGERGGFAPTRGFSRSGPSITPIPAGGGGGKPVSRA
ncbi:hypothetical protein [Ferriphaselus sp. R-1]|uniref:hypothetical protein n=1 Tax=Ferriphaselus sp. R-1 TaxID=1485544 RepID=UPI001268F1B2|nr:hypothetical protein [Ferriphaselus sp. R-1]